MKTIAFYLPQFHEIEENNLWWGKGFTEWASVKASKPNFPFHYQPRNPWKDNFYNLMDKETMKWQCSIAKKAYVDVFCFYHYWFEGKQLLEKPAENLLEWKEINQEFCFSWANETWKRTWSKLTGNDWNEVGDKNQETGKNDGILMKQTYGTREAWEKHFNYLLPFFMDKRYIKVNGEPVFLIYKPKEIPCLDAMLTCWNELAVENGIPGVYVIATNEAVPNCKNVKAIVQYEPAYTLNKDKPDRYVERDRIISDLRKKGIKIPIFYNYDLFWKKILERKHPEKKKTFLGGFVDFDNSPRRGMNASLFLGVSPKKFQKYLRMLVDKSKKMNNEFVFLTAWNEWGEGACLEPESKHGYGYLKAVREVMKNYR